MAIGAAASMTFQVVDTYFVAQLGTAELAAMAFTFPVVMILHAIAVGLGTGVTAVVSRFVGGGGAESKAISTDSLFLAVLVTTLFSAIGFFTIEPVFTMLGAEPDIMPLIRDYMEIWYLGIIFMIVPLIGNSVIRAHGDAKFPSLIMTIAAVLNIILDPILIFGLFGAPRLELQGAALATVIARFVTFAAALGVLHFRMHALTYEMPTIDRLTKNWRLILSIGLPSTATQMIMPVSMGILTALIASFGSVAVAAYGVASRVEMFALIFVMAMSISMGPFVGQNAGAGRIDRVKEALRFAFQASFAYGVMMAFILAFFGDSIGRIFSDDAEVVRLAAFYLLVVPVSYPVLAIIGISSQAFNSLARPMPAMVIGACKAFLVQVPLAYAGAYFGGIQGIFISMGLSTVLVSGLAYVWLRRTVNEEEALIAQAPVPQAS
ncbi:MAG: MATE family efflux transporter [Rhodospirillaceae bacterium]|nr:MATE family efflux transporter [Rhodospirillaceae bacterium]MBT5241353.1 MATE family efflux transporter [Rhodospirillaceae bacterium]MBT5566545.1 MATE family efflux transporter [Rhodospirillaceae bacterium]MBT6089616.1 MATE family efflux transporter [Rhodospirillaceae bacterium]MBT6961324.1 MATE family efflux transporter [Rhodospirillaceae bacterium]